MKIAHTFKRGDRVKVTRESKIDTDFTYVVNKLIGRSGKIAGYFKKTHVGVRFESGIGLWCIPVDMLEMEPTIEQMARELANSEWFTVIEAECRGRDLEEVCYKYDKCWKCIISRFTPAEIHKKYAEMKGHANE